MCVCVCVCVSPLCVGRPKFLSLVVMLTCVRVQERQERKRIIRISTIAGEHWEGIEFNKALLEFWNFTHYREGRRHTLVSVGICEMYPPPHKTCILLLI